MRGQLFARLCTLLGTYLSAWMNEHLPDRMSKRLITYRMPLLKQLPSICTSDCTNSCFSTSSIIDPLTSDI